MNLTFDNGKPQDEEVEKLLINAAELVLSHNEVFASNIEVSVSFVDEDEIKRINTEYREIAQSTDVLSFPMFEDLDAMKEALKQSPKDIEILIGDVIICEPIAEKQAVEFGHSLNREITYLFVHSMLHLLGYGHEYSEDDRRVMRIAEEEVMQKVGLSRN